MSTVRLALALSVFVFAACSNNSGDDHPPPSDDTSDNPDARVTHPPDADNPACADVHGTWGIEGTCGADFCTFTQAGCAITAVECNSGAHSTSGTLDGNHFTYDGVSNTGVPATCMGTLSGDTMAGTCDIAGLGTCDFSGTR